MAEPTYKIIKRTEYPSRGNAPVYIDTSEVLKDSSGGTVMRLKLYNNSASEVRSAYFNAGCFDKDLNLCMQLKNVPYINVNARPSSVFGEAQYVELPDMTQSVFVEVAKVLFEDGSSWVNPNQSLAENIVSEEALGEDWQRLRLTKEIKDRNSEKKQRKNLMSENKKMAIIGAIIGVIVLLVIGGALVSKYMAARELDYKTAMNLYLNRDYQAAAASLSELDGDYKFFGDEAREIQYAAAISYMHTADYQSAMEYFFKCGDYKNSVQNRRTILDMNRRLIAAGYNHSAVVHKDGTVEAYGDNRYGQCDTADWSRVIGVAAGGNHTVGMTYDGMLYACGDNEYGQCDVSAWTDIVAVATGDGHTAAVKANGRVVARGNNEYGQCDIQDWSDIVQLALAAKHTIGLKSDGTVVATGWNQYGQCDVSGERDVLYIATGEKNTVLVKVDGSVKVLGDNSFSQRDTTGVSDITVAAVGTDYIVYTNASGRAKSAGKNSDNQGSVALWTDVMAVACGNNHTLGLSAEESIYAIGDESDNKLKVSKLANIGAENIPITE